MSQQVRRWIPGSWALWILLLVMGLTWPQDDAGRSAAQCSFLGSAGTPTLCSTTDALPTTTLGPTQTTTDPTGWGRNWFQSTGLTNNAGFVVLSAEGQTFYAVERVAGACPGGDLRTFVSNNGGRTFALQDTTTGLGISGVNGTVRVSGGAFLIATSDCGTNFPLLRSSSGFQWVRATRPPSGTCAAGSACPFFAVASQGNTVIASGNVARCRSTDGGASFPSCAVTAPRSNTYHTLASPSVNTWLGYDVGGDSVHRSTDDGVTWVNVLASSTGGAGRGVVECLSPTVCLAAGGTTIRRSTNAGATWTTIFSEPFANNLTALVSFGSGVAVAWSPNADRVYRTNDSGATWNFQVIGPDIDFGFTTGDYAGGVTLNGRGLLGGTGRGTTNGVAYSPVVGAGETIVAGQNGARWEINPSGEGETSTVIRDSTQTNAATVTAGGRLGSRALLVEGAQRTCSEPAANTAATITVTGVASQRIILFDYIAFYTTAPAAAQTLTVTSAAINIWLDIVNGANTPTARVFSTGLLPTDGNTLTVTLPAGGAAVVGKLCATVTGPFIP